MTNNTDTLNGALQELGETMAANVTTMGVPSTYDEGLTTLAGKILSISPVPPTPAPASIDLTGTKSILSYADSEQSVLTATVLDEDEEPVEGVDVNLYNGSTLWDTLTTGSDGTVSKTYSSAGSGDIVFTAEVDGTLLTKTFVVQDCDYYADTTKIGNWTNAGSGANSFKVSTYSIGLTNYSVEIKFNALEPQIMVGNASNWVTGVSLASSPAYFYSHASNGNTVTDALSNVVASDIWRIEVEGTTIRLYRNDVLTFTKSNCKVDYPKNLRLYPQGKSASMDYVKVKPL